MANKSTLEKIVSRGNRSLVKATDRTNKAKAALAAAGKTATRLTTKGSTAAKKNMFTEKSLMKADTTAKQAALRKAAAVKRPTTSSAPIKSGAINNKPVATKTRKIY